MPGRTTARGYGTKHQRLRKRWGARVRTGTVLCARCGELILPGESWDLGHDDVDRAVYSGPEHARCNRATAGRGTVDRYAFARGAFASRHWFPMDGYSPNVCRDCHARGSACDAVLAHEAKAGA